TVEELVPEATVAIVDQATGPKRAIRGDGGAMEVGTPGRRIEGGGQVDRLTVVHRVNGDELADLTQPVLPTVQAGQHRGRSDDLEGHGAGQGPGRGGAGAVPRRSDGARHVELPAL